MLTATTVLSMGAADAHAGLLGSVIGKTTGVVGQTTTTVTQTTTSLTNLTGAITEGVTSGVTGATSGSNLTQVLEGVTCPPLTAVQEAVEDTGLNPIVSGVTSLACSASLLQYEYRTTYRKPDGTNFVRVKSAVLGTPTALDVDADGSPDLTGTISFTGLNSVGLKVDKVATAAAKAVQVEAILSDTSSHLLGKDRLAIGYDARMDRSPGGFTLSTPVDALLGGRPEYQFDVTQTARAEKIAVIGALYDGTPAAPVNPTEFRLFYGASPDTSTLKAKLGEPIEATLTTNRPGPAELSARIVDGARTDRIQANITNLPTSLTISAATQGALRATYSAAARVARLTAQVDRLDGSTLTQRAELDLTDVPTGLHVVQDEDGASVTTTGGPIGLTKVGVANGLPRYLSGEPAYAHVLEEGGLRSTTAVIPGLERASFALGAAPALSAKLQATPFRVLLDRPSQRIDARVLDLPQQVDLGLDLGNGTVRYDGFGDGIAKVTVDGRQTSPFFGRATHLQGTIEQVPAALELALSEEPEGRFAVTASNPIGRIDLAAANRPLTAADAIAGSHQGVRYTDKADEYVLAARVLQLKRLAAGLGDTVDVEAQTAGGFFTADVATDDLTAEARIADLPAVARITANTGQGRLGFSGKDAAGQPQGIDRLDLTLASADGIVGRATNLAGHIEGIPAELTLDIAQDGAGAQVVASAPIQLVELSAANRALTGTELPLNGEQGIRYVDVTDGDYVLGARVRRLERLEASLGTPLRVLAHTAGGPFSLGVRTDDLRATGRIEDLPERLLATVDLDAGKVDLDARNAAGELQDIQRILLDVSSREALVGRATDLHAELQGIAGDLTVDLAQAGDGVSITADRPIGRIEVVGRNGEITDPAADLPVNDEQGVKLTDRADGDYVLAARIKRFERAAATFGDTITLGTTTASGPFGVRVDTDDLSGLARIEDLPSVFDATLDLAAGKVQLRGRDDAGEPQDLGRLTADLASNRDLFGRARFVKADIQDIPADLLLDIAQTGEGAKVAASEPIGRLELVAASRAPQADDLPSGDEQGAKLVDLSGGDFVIGARLKEFRSVEGRFGDQVQLATRTASGPFGVRVVNDDLRALARIADLPAQLDATFDLTEGRLQLTGKDADGSDAGPIETVDVAVSGTEPVFGRATDLDAHLEDVPSTVVLSFAQSGDGATVTSEPAIGLVEVVAKAGAIDRAADLPEDGDQGAKYVDTPEAFLVSARVRELERVVASLGDSVHLETKTAGGPFRVVARTADLDAQVRFQDLPSSVTADFDPDAGRFSYDGSSAIELATIDIKGVGGRAVLGRANRLNATIKHLAPGVDLAIDPSGPTADVTASEPIEELSILATDIPEGEDVPGLPDGEQGAILRDVAGQPYVLRARLLDLKRIAFGLGGDRIGIDAEVRSTPFGIDAQTAGLQATARIDKLPAKTALTFDLDGGELTYAGRDADGNGAQVDDLTFRAVSDDALFGRAKVLSGRLAGIPSDIAVTFDAAAGGAKVTIPDGQDLDTFELLAAEDADQAFPIADQGVTFRDNADEFLVAARVLGLKGLDVGLADAIGLTIDRTEGSRFRADIDVEGTLAATADIQDLPAFAQLGLDLEGTSTTAPNALTFKGRDADGNPKGIDVFDLSAAADEPILGGGRFIQGHIEDLPGDVELSFSQENARASVIATQPVGKIELAASDTAGAFEYPTDANGQPAQGAVLRSKTGEPFRIGLRILQLDKLVVNFATAIDLTTKTAGGPFIADVDTDTFSADAKILDLPETLNLGLDLESGQVSYTGSAPIGRIYAQIAGEEPLFLGATGVEVDLQQVPTAFTLNLAQGETDVNGLKLSADNPIGQIDVRAKSSDREYPVIPAGEAGAVLDTATEGSVALALRVFKLQLLDVTLDPVALEARMEGGRKFTVDAKLPEGLEVDAVIDRLPATVKLGLGDLAAGGSELKLEGSAPIDFVRLEAQGLELLEGADHVIAEIDQLPEKVTVSLPETGELARIEARNAAGALTAISQLRLAAASGTPNMPARTTSAAGGNDLLRFTNTASTVDIGARLSGVKRIGLNLEPIGIDAELTGGRKLDVDATVANESGNGNTDLNATIDALPSALTLALQDAPVSEGGGTKLVWDASAPIAQIALSASGVELLDGADSLQADIRGVPAKFNVALPDQEVTPKPPLAKLSVTGANLTGSGGPRINELRLAAGAGSLPASGGNDKFTYIDGDTLNVGVKLSNIKGLSMNLDPINLTIDQEDQENGGTKPIDINASLPNDSGPAATVTGQFNKPSFHTEVNVAIPPSGSGQPNRLTFVNGTNAQRRSMASISLNAQNLGSIKSATFGLERIPHRLQACLATDGGCRPTDRVPAAHGNYTGHNGSPNQSATAGGLNRPYAAQTSIDLNDFGTSGSGSAVGDMVGLDANLDLGDGNPIQITDLYFHRIALDLGQNGTFGYLGQDVPRLYMFIDSENKPYVMNSVKYPPTIQDFRLGTNGSPARADRRLVWLPGQKCTTRVFGACITSGLDDRANGGHQCGGQRNLTIRAGFLGNINILSIPIVGQLVPVCQ